MLPKSGLLDGARISELVRASISVSGIFTPVRSNGHILVDGGLTNPVPVSAVRTMGADIVITVGLNHEIVVGNNLKQLLATEKRPTRKIAHPICSRAEWVTTACR